MVRIVILIFLFVSSGLAAKCARSSVNIRSGAGVENGVIARASAGDRFNLVGASTRSGEHDWFQVSRCGSTDVIGWIAMSNTWFDDCECADAAAVQQPNTDTSGWPLHYDAPSRCTGGPTSGAQALADALKRAFPVVTSTGIYNCRSVRGGSSVSEHAEGRAVDFMVRIGAAGNQEVADFLVANARQLGIQSVIFNRRVWGYGRWSWRAYTGENAHVDHVHTGMHRDGSRGLTPAAVQAVLDGRNGGGAPAPAPPAPTEQPASDNGGGGGDNKCIRANAAVNIRSGPSLSNRIMIVAFEGEQFSEQSRQADWVQLSNGRGSGWSSARFWNPCGSEPNARSLSEGVSSRAGDDGSDKVLNDWAIGLIAGIGGTLIVVAIIALILYMRKNNTAAQAQHWRATEEGEQSPRSEPRTSYRKTNPLGKSGSLIASSPAFGRRRDGETIL